MAPGLLLNPHPTKINKILKLIFNKDFVHLYLQNSNRAYYTNTSVGQVHLGVLGWTLGEADGRESCLLW